MEIDIVADIHIKMSALDVFEYDRLMALADILKNNKSQAVWILGDLFDKHSPNLFEIKAANDFIQAIGKPIYFLEGNHERISHETYTLHLLKDTLGMQPLPDYQEIEGVSIVAVGHNKLCDIATRTEADILLSHFRWTHPLYGVGEIGKESEWIIVDKYKNIILGDIHDNTFKPAENVVYTGSPYSISYSSHTNYGYITLTLDGNYNIEQRQLALPNKVKLMATLNTLQGLVVGLDSASKYRIVVNLMDNEVDAFKNIKVPDNIELIGKIMEEHKEERKIDVGNDIKKVFLSSLRLREDEIKYIDGIICQTS